MDVDEDQARKPAPLKDPPVCEKPDKPIHITYDKGKRWADDSSDSESEDDIKSLKSSHQTL